jgi:hypothetical protein
MSDLSPKSAPKRTSEAFEAYNLLLCHRRNNDRALRLQGTNRAQRYCTLDFDWLFSLSVRSHKEQSESHGERCALLASGRYCTRSANTAMPC